MSHCQEQGHLQEWFETLCVDAYEPMPGKLGQDLPGRLLLVLGRENLWPVAQHVQEWDDDALFDMIEFLYDHVSSGVRDSGRHHDYNSCGWHYEEFTPEPARGDYRTAVNELLRRMPPGYELSLQGEILRSVPSGVAPLLTTASRLAPATQREHVEAAVTKYRARSSTPTDRRDAVRDLADVLENLRSQVKATMPSKDEAALFEIANKFWIRHNKPEERRDYDHEAWWAWLFYVYLSSIALVTHLLERDDQQ